VPVTTRRSIAFALGKLTVERSMSCAASTCFVPRDSAAIVCDPSFSCATTSSRSARLIVGLPLVRGGNVIGRAGAYADGSIAASSVIALRVAVSCFDSASRFAA